MLFIYREDYYVASREPKAPKDDDDIKIVEAYQQWQQDMGRVYGMAEVIVAKQRHGSTGKVRAQVRQPHHQVQRRGRRRLSAGDAQLATRLVPEGGGMRASARVRRPQSIYGPMSSLLSGCSIFCGGPGASSSAFAIFLSQP